jgi:hypothetical protein
MISGPCSRSDRDDRRIIAQRRKPRRLRGEDVTVTIECRQRCLGRIEPVDEFDGRGQSRPSRPFRLNGLECRVLDKQVDPRPIHLCSRCSKHRQRRGECGIVLRDLGQRFPDMLAPARVCDDRGCVENQVQRLHAGHGYMPNRARRSA